MEIFTRLPGRLIQIFQNSPFFFKFSIFFNYFFFNKINNYKDMISDVSSYPQHIIIGSYSDSKPIPSLHDFVTKDMAAIKINKPLTNPSYVYVRNNHYYIVQQADVGHLAVINHKHQLLASVETRGNGPCHISMNSQGNRLVVTNYWSGSFIMYEIKDCLPVKVLSFIVHEGSSINAQRQSSAHTHCSVFDQQDKNLFIPDLGTDTVYWYEVRYDGEQHLVNKKQCGLKIQGCGPRHLAKGEKGSKILYLSGELDSSIRVLSYKKDKLQLIFSYKLSNNPKNLPSQIKYRDNAVLMAARGDNEIIIMDSQSEGRLKERLRIKVGEWPRHFNITKCGTILVACQHSNIIQRFRVDKGEVLELERLNVNISSPSCISFEE